MLNSILKELQEKHHLLEKLEEISAKMMGDNIEELIEYDSERMKIIEELKKLDEHVIKIYENSSNADSIVRAISNKEDPSNVSKDLLPIYNCSKENFKIIAKLQTFQKEYDCHLVQLRDSLLHEIKGNEQNAKLTKYLNALDEQIVPVGSLLSQGSRKA